MSNVAVAPSSGRHLEPERQDRVDEAAQLLRPIRAATGLLEPEPQLAVAQHADRPQIDALRLHLRGRTRYTGARL